MKVKNYEYLCSDAYFTGTALGGDIHDKLWHMDVQGQEQKGRNCPHYTGACLHCISAVSFMAQALGWPNGLVSYYFRLF